MKNPYLQDVRDYDVNAIIQAKNYWQKRMIDLDLSVYFNINSIRVRETSNNQECKFIYEAPIEIYNKLNQIAPTAESKHILLLCALGALTQKYSTIRDICIFTPAYINVLADGVENEVVPFRMGDVMDLTFPELLHSTKSHFFNDLRHINYPLEKILKSEKNKLTDISVVGLNIEGIQSISSLNKLSLDLLFNFNFNKALTLIIKYDGASYDEDKVARIADFFFYFLNQMILKKDERIGKIELIDAKEKDLILNSFSETINYSLANKTFLDLFFEHVEKSPKKIALRYKSVEMTYKDVKCKSDSIVSILRENGIKKGCLVGIYLKPSENLLPSILGVLMAGGAFIPVDYKNSNERNKYILNNGNVDFVITDDELKGNELLNEDNGADKKIINVSEIDINNEVNSIGKIDILDNDLAYVLYTSGSTGVPKGVMIGQEALMNYLIWAKNEYLEQDCPMALFTSIGFDLTVTTLFLPIISGNVLELYDQTDDEPIIIKVIKESNAKVIKLTPSHLRMICESKVKFENVKRFIVGGEQLPYELANEIYNIGNKEIDIYNEYGPTEATVGCTISKFDPSLTTDNGSVSIGKPAPNCEIYILDSNLNVVPHGIQGEIYIGGKQLFKGYLASSAQTNSNLIVNPFNKNEKLYRTGDIAYWSSDGSIVFVGRKDNQVKIRGYRIELGEIENVLQKYEKIKSSVVIARQKQEDSNLCAYFTCSESIDENELREFMKDKIPEYMLPTYFIELDKIPTTNNGKIDRKKLPETNLNLKVIIPPSNRIEAQLVNIWSEVLSIKKENISTDKDFYSLGGHSISIILVVNKIKKLFEVSISLSSFFKNSSIQNIAKLIKENTDENVALPTLIPDVENKYEPFPLTDVQQAYWIGRSNIFSYGNIGTHAYVEVLFRDLDVNKFNQAIQTLIERHEMMRVVFDKSGRQRILKEVPLYVVKVLDLREMSDQKGDKVFYQMRDELSHQIFSGEEWPLFDIRVTIFKDGTKKVHYSMDALIMDASSLIMLNSEFQMLYEDITTELPPIEISFRDYIMTELKFRETPLYEKSKQYWLNRIDTLPFAPDLPLKNADNKNRAPRFIRHFAELKSSDWEKLQSFSKNMGITPTVCIIGCFAEILKFWSKTPHFTLNLTLFNRIPFHESVNRIVGDFTSLTLLEIDARTKKSMKERLLDIQERLWGDLEYKYYSGIEVLRELSKKYKEPVMMPVVVTSTIGLLRDENDDEQQEQFQDRKQKPYSISQTPQVWLDFQVGETNDGLFFNWDSIEGLFQKEMLDDMFSSFLKLIQAIIADEATVGSLAPAVVLPEKQKGIRQANELKVSGKPGKLLHELFIDRVNEFKDKEAVISDRRNLTYGELDKLRKAIGANLRDSGAVPNNLVAIVMYKGWEQIAASLGVLSSGAAYLPIDASLPQNRIELLLEQGKVKNVVTTPEVAGKVDFPEGLKVLAIGEILLLEDELEDIDIIQKPDDLAYVIFTSGSTGVPKGVMIDHVGAVNTIIDINERFSITSNDKVLALSSLSFDLSVYDVFGLLGSGGTIVMPNQDELKEPDTWIRYMKEFSVTVWNTVPALMQMLVECAGRNSEWIECLRLILMSGDWIPVDLPNRIREHREGIEIISLGGATEASIWSIWYNIGKVNPEWKSIPYGIPLKNQACSVLNQDLEQCPDYATGEIHIGGIGLAKGYWLDEEKTDAKFIIHPRTKERLYKTGDLGRYSPDGNIEFLGRKDSQVKIQGYRIELGEIESAIEQYENVKEVAVTVTETDRESKALVAYVVPSGGSGKTNNQKEENIGELVNAGNTIVDKNKRTLFKLEQHGIRKLNGQQGSVKLSGSSVNNSISIRDNGSVSGTFNEKTITIDEFSTLFACLKQEAFDELVLPKYYYPSAGSLYPVQTYVTVKTSNIQGVDGGFYYYNPQKHELELISKATNGYTGCKHGESSFMLHLVADLNAIEPMYGDFSETFCYQEAGYMSNLLIKNSIPGFTVRPKDGIDEKELSDNFLLGENYLHLCSLEGGGADKDPNGILPIDPLPLTVEHGDGTKSVMEAPVHQEAEAVHKVSIVERKSYREFEGKGLISEQEIANILRGLSINSSTEGVGLAPYIIVKSDKVHGIKEGVYKLDMPSMKLVCVNSLDGSEAIFNGNDLIYESSGFSILLIGSRASLSSAMFQESLYISGFIGQNLMNVSTGFDIGFCAIGTVDQAAARKSLRLQAGEEVIHSFIGGKITQAQKQSLKLSTSDNKASDTAQKIKDFLKERLPNYMVPSYFVQLEKLPLTPNGKIDRKALPKLDVFEKEEFVLPANKIQIKLADIWSKVLDVNVEKISIRTSFFELGGHSIKATILVNEINKDMGIKVPLKVIFENNTIEELSNYIESDPQLFNTQFDDTDENVALPTLIPDVENKYEPFPLTDVQQAYWIGRSNIFSYGNIGTHAYVEVLFRDLDVNKFNQAIQTLIERHEMMRVVFDKSGRQRILKEVPLYVVKVLDLREMSDQKGDKVFYQMRDELSHQIFSGEEWPLFDIRVTIFKDGTKKVHYSMDALIMDASSLIMLNSEFQMLYEDITTELPPIEISFRDYIMTELKFRETPLYEKSKQYWLNRIDTLPFAPDLPLKNADNKNRAPRFIRHFAELKSSDWEKLQSFSKNMGITPTVCIIGCFAEILKFWSKTPHFTLNLTLFNRIPFHESVNRIVGDFTSLTLLEIDARTKKSMKERLLDIQERLWGDLEYKYYSGIEVLRELSKKYKEPVMMPVVVTSTIGLLRDENDDEQQEQFQDRKQKPYSISQTPQVWLDFQVGETNDGLFFNWDSIEGLFQKEMLDDMFSSFLKLIQAIIADEATVGSLAPAVVLPEKQKGIRQANELKVSGKPGKLLHELFIDRVNEFKDKEAVISDRRNLTYGELDKLRKAIGANLRDSGAVPNNLVAIVMYKGWEQIAASLGVLSSGAAYLPIDASLPQNRIELLLEQGKVKNVVTTPEVAGKVDFPEGLKVLAIGEILLLEDELEDIDIIQKPDDLAYVIFTSGSTGVPKGVMIDHVGAVNTIIDINERFSITSNDKVLALSSLSFDLSVYDVFGLLGSGGTIVMPNQDELKEPDTWIRYMKEFSVTVWNTVPALMQMLVECAGRNSEWIECLRLILMSGDWIPVDLPNRIREHREGIEIISLGGATEASIWSIWYNIGKVNPEWKSIPYGIPLKNQACSVLNQDLEQCPDYATGEIHIGGIGLAKGYWLDEEKTDAKFIIHPRTKERLYKTGDLGRYSPDGNIEFLGRKDSQVKIQGYRIELGEIESAIEQYENVKEVAVTVTETDRESKALVAYVVPSGGSGKTNNQKEENIGELVNAGNTIVDKNKRTLFKLEQHGIRKLNGQQGSVKLSGSSVNNSISIRDNGSVSGTFNEKTITIDEFSTLFACLKQEAFDELVLPKYYYPSAGSLYPVQTYVTVKTSNIQGVDGGFYYYNPQKHELELISKATNGYTGCKHGESSFMLHLVADLNAIEPMYGDFSETFCYQEAGYMSNLLIKNSIPGFTVRPKDGIDEKELSDNFLLGENYLHLCSLEGGGADKDPNGILPIDPLPLTVEHGDGTKSVMEAPVHQEAEAVHKVSIVERKSYREFEGKGLISEQEIANILRGLSINSSTEGVGLAPYIIVKSDKVHGIKEGVYKLDMPSMKLVCVNSLDGSEAIFNGNDLIYESSGFSILLIGSRASLSSAMFQESLYISGFIGQNLMNVSTGFDIGFCAIGTVDQAAARKSLRLQAGEEVIHSFIGGKITQAQKQSLKLSTSDNKASDTAQKIKDFLKERLPNYMVPSYFVQLEKLPLTPNGKIDRKALPKLDVFEKEEFVLPANKIQIKLADIWSKVLDVNVEKISIRTSFFELGGHSIKATILVNEINKDMGIKVPLKVIFENNTIEELSNYIESDPQLFNTQFDETAKTEIVI